MKKVLSLIISFAIALCAIVPVSFQAMANSFENAVPISLGNIQPGAICGATDKIVNYWYRFDCPSTGYYSMKASSITAPDGEIEVGVYDSAKNLVNFAVNSNNAVQFEFATYMTAGASYFYRFSIDGTVYNFNAEISVHNHVFSITESIRAIADDDAQYRLYGYTNYACGGCGYSYTAAAYPPPSYVFVSGNRVFTGEAVTPAITVTDSNGSVVSPDNYSVSYEDNIMPGIAYATITFNSAKYIGELTTSYIIKPKKAKAVSLKSKKSRQITFVWEKDTVADGYEYQYSTSKKFYKSKTKTVTVTNKSKNKATIKKLIAKKKYYTRIRAYKIINGEKHYGKWSKALSTKVKK